MATETAPAAPMPAAEEKGQPGPGSRGSASSQGEPEEKTNENETPVPDLDASENPAADWRNMRRIIAEDPEWTLATVPDLTELCIRHIVETFVNNSKVLNDLVLKDQNSVLSRIPSTLPLKITAPLIADEDYWERCCYYRWEVCDVESYGGSWKRMLFERIVQNLIELFVPESSDFMELHEMLELGASVIRKLDIRQLLPPVKVESRSVSVDQGADSDSDSEDEAESGHFNFEPVLRAVPQLEEFHVTYGVRDCGMNFEWSSFLFKNSDCLKLAQNVANCHMLRVFRLHRSKVDDEKVRVLTYHILNHPALVELDLSFNVIGDQGARALGMLLNNRSQLVRLNLRDNNIRGPGAMALAHGLIKTGTLRFLNLKHNHLSDEGGQAISRALNKNDTLKEIILSCNELGEPTAYMLSQAMALNCTLQYVDLSCNRLGVDGGKHILEGMETNSSIQDMDLRLTEVGQEADYNINLLLHRNREASREQAIKEREAHAPPQRKELDPQEAHRYVLPPDVIY